MSKIKLTGDSSGYVEISAANAAGNNTLEAPTSGTRLVAHEGTQDVVLGGNLTVNGVLTYEDVTNIDSVGVITARSGIHVTGGRVGIGTDNPQEDLHIKASGSSIIKLDTTSPTGASSLQLKGGSGRIDFGVPEGSNNRGRILYANNANTVTGAAGDRMEFFTNNDTSNSAVGITSDNKIGIRSDTPKTEVDINCYNSDNGNYRGTVKINRYGHILQQNNSVVNNTGVSSYWSLAPRDNGDFDISFDEVDAPNTFNAAGFDVLRLTDNGNVSVPNGNLIIASGQGIDFSANASDYGTPGSELLDDYEEGNITTWRLRKNNANTNGSNNVVTHVRYTKIGRCVYISGYIRTDGTQSSQSGNALLVTVADATVAATLPFTPNHTGGIPITHTRTINELTSALSLSFVKDSATVYIYRNEHVNDYVPDTNNLDTNTQTNICITFSGHFFTDS